QDHGDQGSLSSPCPASRRTPGAVRYARSVFERFTGPARQPVVLAQEESRRLGHDHIGTEHLLLGLLREEEGIAARVLDALDVTLDEGRAEVLRVKPRGEVPSPGQITFTPRGKRTLELALQEA